MPDLEGSFIEDEFDAHASALGAKGIGELGAVGAGPAIANAVFHATGIRGASCPSVPRRSGSKLRQRDVASC